LDTLSSLEEQAERDTIHAAEPGSIGPYVLRALHKRICSNPAISEPLKKAIEAAAAQGAKLTTPTSEQLAVGVATVIGVTIATAFTGPIAVAVAPLIGGVALLIVQCGLDAFCEWAQSNQP
jgi:hypothetical protein